MTGRIHSFESFGTVDGPGIRYVVFLQGCPLRCQYCHNPDTWGAGGKEYEAEEVARQALRYKNYFGPKGGVTVTGGEPLLQIDFIIELFTILKEKGIQFDLVSYDCTFGVRSSGGGNHMGVPDNVEARKRFIENGNYKDTTISVITHFSHNNPNVGYDDMLKVAQENGFMLSYDGMIIEF